MLLSTVREPLNRKCPRILIFAQNSAGGGQVSDFSIVIVMGDKYGIYKFNVFGLRYKGYYGKKAKNRKNSTSFHQNLPK